MAESARSAGDQQLVEDSKTMISQIRQTNKLTDEEKETLKTTHDEKLGARDISQWFAGPEGEKLEDDFDFFKDYNKKRDELMSKIKKNRKKIEELSDTRMLLESKIQLLKTRSTSDEAEKNKLTLKTLDEVLQLEEQNKETLEKLEERIASLYTYV